jgi:hypothetical protein
MAPTPEFHVQEESRKPLALPRGGRIGCGRAREGERDAPRRTSVTREHDAERKIRIEEKRRSGERESRVRGGARAYEIREIRRRSFHFLSKSRRAADSESVSRSASPPRPAPRPGPATRADYWPDRRRRTPIPGPTYGIGQPKFSVTLRESRLPHHRLLLLDAHRRTSRSRFPRQGCGISRSATPPTLAFDSGDKESERVTRPGLD